MQTIIPIKGIAAIICGSFAFSVAACSTAQEDTESTNDDVSAYNVTSPDGDIELSFFVEDGIPKYRVEFDDQPLLPAARLGLRFQNIGGLDENLRISRTERSSTDEAWEQPWGERRLMREHYNELGVELQNTGTPSRKMTLRFRVFDDGLGFRYEVPDYGSVNVIDELTEFQFDPDSTAWWIPADRFNRYEYIYQTTSSREIEKAHTPLTLRTPDGVHLSFHEAALIDYPAYSMDMLRDGIFQTALRPWSDGVRAKKQGAFVTPWRTIQISQRAVDLLNSDLILNLNEPNKLGDVSWVEPGKYVGIWWCMHIRLCTWGSGEIHGATTERAKEYIDFAAENGFTGVLIEGWNIGWDGDWFFNGDVFSFTESYPDFDLDGVAEYALDRDVRLVGHHETSGSISNYEAQLEDALDLYQSLGVAQIKTGYVADAGDIKRIDQNGIPKYEWHDSQVMARHHLKVVEEAAKRQISINAHEPIKDTGLRRTYPNWISREGARGQEFNAWGFPTLNPPEHVPILVYTRMLSGPMDFTPGIFNLTFDGPDGDNRVQTTLAKQLALYVVLYSPIQMAADLPEHYEAYPDAFQFIKDVPSDWETSIALQGEVGDFVVFARQNREADDWYLGAVTDEEARDLSVSLDFLDASIAYEAQIYRDADDADWKTNPHAYTIETRTVRSSDSLDLKLAPGGGAAVRIVPAE